jgi:putrescine transport system ATP-binding protein
VSEAGHETAINRLDGVIADICYLGGTTTYKVKLDAGGIVQASVANSARLDVDAYSLNQHVVAWFTPDDCMVLSS